uniref:Sema domain-containing protein n=1 Tax=Sphenodon punctatus TaxID=8508 RepID=A0A8D0G7D4_SPHPU
MALWIWTLSILSYSCITCGYGAKKPDYFRSENELIHLAVNDDTGTVYLGAVNALYQLTKNLSESQLSTITGPKLDSKKCTPPIDQAQCSEAKMTDNFNKLLLLDKQEKRIVECGSLFKGICAIRELENISNVIYYDISKGEKSFVASNDEKVSTVGLITSLGKQRMLFVGKGNGPNDNGIIISTRQLFEDVKEIFESYADSAAIKSVYHSSNTQQFVYVFEDNVYVYFIFNQEEKQPPKNRTLIARLCKNDDHYYSYFEMDLICKDGDNVPSNETVLLALFSRVNKHSGSLESAMCMFSLKKINEKIEDNREKCYANNAKDLFYKPFSTDSVCVGINGENVSKTFPCGYEHLPYPLGSTNGVTTEPLLKKEGINLTAVTMAVENGHTVAFLGTSDGKLLKVLLTIPATEYSVVPIETNKPIKNDLVLDANQENLYVFRIPVQECASYSNCSQCTHARDPYCGWCVAEGTCTKKIDCERASMDNHWLWSPDGICLAIDSAHPQNMSRNAQGMVELIVKPLPKLIEGDKLWCNFGETFSVAELRDETIICDCPNRIPRTPAGQGSAVLLIQPGPALPLGHPGCHLGRQLEEGGSLAPPIQLSRCCNSALGGRERHPFP